MRASPGQAAASGVAYRTAFATLCKVVRGRPEQVDWASFSLRYWQALAELAEQHGVAPIAYYRLEQSDWLNLLRQNCASGCPLDYYQSSGWQCAHLA